MLNDYFVRFNSLSRLIGKESLEKLNNAHFCVIGLGGVGSWAAEALARCGVGNITLIDFDEICKSNVNRQIHALDDELHKPKVEVMAQRIKKINPHAHITPIQSFFTYSTADSILSARYDYIIDAMDTPSKKCFLAHKCKQLGIPLIVTGAAGGKLDPTQIKTGDLSEVYNDRLLQEVRKKLRAKYNFPNAPHPMGIDAVFSTEPRKKSIGEHCRESSNPSPAVVKSRGLNCETGLGTAVFVTATFGFVAIARAISRFLGLYKDNLSQNQVEPKNLKN
ncbi:MAG: tRNA threonylcarbamoyladenosine dehydratase [Verrucomicrobiia bacterium]|jgi:tRNA A37 threonylcarbamoyladenosine dehydratase